MENPTIRMRAPLFPRGNKNNNVNKTSEELSRKNGSQSKRSKVQFSILMSQRQLVALKFLIPLCIALPNDDMFRFSNTKVLANMN